LAESTISRVWNAFRNNTPEQVPQYGEVRYSVRPDRPRFSFGNERSIIASIYNRLALDIASSKIQHVRVDENERFLETINSGLNDCLNVSANLDQTGTAFLQDAAISLFDDGAIAIVAVDTTRDPTDSDNFDVRSLRVGKIREWYPSSVRVDIYNEQTGKHEEVILPKRSVAIIENPLYTIMNEQNSTLKRLLNKLNLLDSIDNISASGKLDMIIQLPYALKSEAKADRAAQRMQEIQDQLSNSDLGIAYTDATEKITQLNRPVENKLMAQVEYLTSMLYSQLGLTTSIMDGTAEEATMLNYYKRTIKPVTAAIVDSMYRTFVSKTGRTQGQRLMVYADPFMLVPMSSLADIADKLTRNEVLSSNDMRSVIGFKPDPDPESDKLRNKNLNDPNKTPPQSQPKIQIQNPIASPEGGIQLDDET
jgi:hypothetical protein